MSVLAVLSVNAQNNPYVDDKLLHWGFSLGINFMDYGITPSLEELNGDIYHARVSGLTPGLSVGFIADLRMSRHLNLRFTPQLHFSSTTIRFRAENDENWKGKSDITSIPLTLPLMIKWSAEREGNYRPYLIAGGGARLDFAGFRKGGSNDKQVLFQKVPDAFIEIGAGCDFYFSWFKFCPQITYSIGFLDVLNHQPELMTADKMFYTQSISRLMNRQITLTFNFE